MSQSETSESKDASVSEHTKLCGALKATRAFSHYVYGDPLPCYARYFNGDGEPAKAEDAVAVYVRCERERGHTGRHLARGIEPWGDDCVSGPSGAEA